jgi:hypothetical protein
MHLNLLVDVQFSSVRIGSAVYKSLAQCPCKRRGVYISHYRVSTANMKLPSEMQTDITHRKLRYEELPRKRRKLHYISRHPSGVDTKAPWAQPWGTLPYLSSIFTGLEGVAMAFPCAIHVGFVFAPASKFTVRGYPGEGKEPRSCVLHMSTILCRSLTPRSVAGSNKADGVALRRPAENRVSKNLWQRSQADRDS